MSIGNNPYWQHSIVHKTNLKLLFTSLPRVSHPISTYTYAPFKKHQLDNPLVSNLLSKQARDNIHAHNYTFTFSAAISTTSHPPCKYHLSSKAKFSVLNQNNQFKLLLLSGLNKLSSRNFYLLQTRKFPIINPLSNFTRI